MQKRKAASPILEQAMSYFFVQVEHVRIESSKTFAEIRSALETPEIKRMM